MQIKYIFIINGSGGCGKDTFVKKVSKVLKEKNNPNIEYVKNISSVDKVKEQARTMGWNGGKTDKDRKFLSDLKQLSIKYNDAPFNYVINTITDFINDKSITSPKFLFVHIREPEEIEKTIIGVLQLKCFQISDTYISTIFVSNQNADSINTNTADANVKNYKYDTYIDNSGDLKTLEVKANEFSESIKDGTIPVRSFRQLFEKSNITEEKLDKTNWAIVKYNDNYYIIPVEKNNKLTL